MCLLFQKVVCTFVELFERSDLYTGLHDVLLNIRRERIEIFLHLRLVFKGAASGIVLRHDIHLRR